MTAYSPRLYLPTDAIGTLFLTHIWRVYFVCLLSRLHLSILRVSGLPQPSIPQLLADSDGLKNSLTDFRTYAAKGRISRDCESSFSNGKPLARPQSPCHSRKTFGSGLGLSLALR